MSKRDVRDAHADNDYFTALDLELRPRPPEPEVLEPEPEPESVPEPPAAPTPLARVAWGALFGAKRIVMVIVAVAVTSLLLTMAVNQDMTLPGAINMYIERLSLFVESIGIGGTA